MGFSTPKDPFDLTAFLREKGVPRSRRRPTWNRRQPPEDQPPADEAAQTEDGAKDSAKDGAKDGG